ncbi:MAG TPA: glutamine-hydrolyzing carbamoyl-phosphate synthase small subunit [Bacillota bacterium]|nr:glutamine-hydrolyzing carbamoyl-phosphate synthase small subunit [Bacillota bacterium]
MEAVLALENGSIFRGKAFGAAGEQHGEVVFNTSMTGYQEILTDPSYCGEIVVMTYPLIGNYGINSEDFEHKFSFVRGFVVRQACDHPSNWRVQAELSKFLAERGIIGLEGVDTRALTRQLRTKGTMRGIISTDTSDLQALIEKARQAPTLSDEEPVPTVTTKQVFRDEGPGPRVVVMDFGAKANIMRSLKNLGCDLTVVPAHATAQEILAHNPDGIMLTNGPGDPQRVPYAIETVKQLLPHKPIFGICLGHQILGLAMGGKTYKLKFGHRGANHPVKDLTNGKVNITSQNHGYAVDEDSLSNLPIEVTHRNLNDNTIEGIRHKELPVFSVQYHPEASPGPNDSKYLFEQFYNLMQGGTENNA